MNAFIGVFCALLIIQSALGRPEPAEDRAREILPNGCPSVDPLDHTVHLPHPTDCSKFLKCDNGVSTEQDCPEGLHFNPTLQVCDSPYHAGCKDYGKVQTRTVILPNGCPSVDPLDHTVHLPHPTDCSKFLKCDNGVATEQDCPEGLHFNPTLQVCDSPYHAGCKDYGKVQTRTVILPNGCPSVDPLDHTVHLPHPTDCSKFLKCDKGVAVEQNCSVGLHYNSDLGVCDYPYNAGCMDYGKVETRTVILPNGCPSVDPLDHTVHLPHPTDCSKFLKCDNGVSTEQDCPEGLHFNPTLQVCDSPYHAGCKDYGKVQTRTVILPNGCPSVDPLDHTVHLPHPTDCSKFLKCDNGVATEQDCPEGLHFNPTLQVCDSPYHAGCKDYGKVQTRTVILPNGCPSVDPLDHTVHLPHPTDCSKFLKCDKGVAVEQNCSVGLHYNSDLGVCDYPYNAGCMDYGKVETRTVILPNGCPSVDPLDHTVHLPHPTDCSKFLKCDNGVATEQDCPEGLHFNPTLQVCDSPYHAGCKDYGKVQTRTVILPNGCPSVDPLDHTVHLPHPTDCSKFLKCDNGVATEQDCPEGLHFNPTLQVCDSPYHAGCKVYGKVQTRTVILSNGCPSVDPLDHTVHLPHPTDCSKFLKCDNGVATEQDCPEGLHFNPTLQVCDSPYHAGCKDYGKVQTRTVILPNGCPSVDPLDHTVHLPHPTDCSKFLKCDNGVATEQDCPEGLHFNPTLQVCDSPYHAGCMDYGKVQTRTVILPNGCPSVDPLDHTVHLPHPTDCSKFLKCDKGVAVEQNCSVGLHYNSDLGVCDYPYNAGCSTPSVPLSSRSLLIQCPTPDPLYHTVHLSHPTDCSLFYRCDHGQPKLEACPHGLHFNNVYKVCDWPDRAKCKTQ